MKVLGVYRAERFSPNSIERDKAIMDAVMDAVPACEKAIVSECYLTGSEDADVVLTMARSDEALCRLEEMERRGVKVLNSPSGVRSCARAVLDQVMRAEGIPMPPPDTGNGWWLKRGDAAAQSHEDVTYCADQAQMERVKKRFNERGITDVVTSAHVCGDLVKFYGVKGTGFFRTFYPGDTGRTKFGDERMNGTPHHYPYDIAKLMGSAERLSELTHTPVYGGDCIVEPSGEYRIIDFNDWPSFSPCREEAARAIVKLL